MAWLTVFWRHHAEGVWAIEQQAALQGMLASRMAIDSHHPLTAALKHTGFGDLFIPLIGTFRPSIGRVNGSLYSTAIIDSRERSRKSARAGGSLLPFTSARLLVSLSDIYRRLFGACVNAMGPRLAYQFQAQLASIFYQLAEPIRVRSETQCRAALGSRFTQQQIAKIAKKAFIHRAWNIVDLALADRLVRRSTYHRYGGRIQSDYLDLLHEAQSRHHPVILVTAYYGPFDILPLFLGYNAILASVVYKPHDNVAYDRYRSAIRSRSGCELVPVAQAPTRLPQVLESGGTVAILADHHAERGITAEFLNIQTTVSKSVGLLAARNESIVVVAGIRRKETPFQFELIISDFFGPDAWSDQDDAVAYITQRYLASIEKIILADPSQYLWAHPRWGTQLAGQTGATASDG